MGVEAYRSVSLGFVLISFLSLWSNILSKHNSVKRVYFGFWFQRESPCGWQAWQQEQEAECSHLYPKVQS